MSRGKGGRYLDDDDDYYDPYGDDHGGYSDEDGETTDFVADVRSKLNADQNKKISDDAIVIQLENDDYNVDKTLRAIRDRLKATAPKTAKPAAPTTVTGKAPVVAKSGQTGPKAPSAPTNPSKTNVIGAPQPPLTSNAANSKKSTPVSILTPNDLNLTDTDNLIENPASLEQMEEEATIVVVGHVDAGKSTLVGHLLQQSGEVQSRTVQKYEQAAQSIGKATFGLAWVMDQREDEREHGVTIDIAERRFATEKRKYVIVDTPGHRDFIPNMIKGATQADIALLLLPAKRGEYESAMTNSAQTKEHCYLLKSMGVHHIVLVINKMDQTDPVPWDQVRYSQIVQEISTFLTRDLQFPASHIHAVPVSGLTGENLLNISSETVRNELQWYLQSSEPSSKWYSGRSLVKTLDDISLPPMKQALQKSFRAVANLTDAAKGRLDVHVLQGQLQVGQKLGLAVMLPGIMMAHVASTHAMASAETASSSSTNAAGDTTSSTTGTVSSCRLYSAIVRAIEPILTTAPSTAATSNNSLHHVGPKDHVTMHVEFLSSSFAGVQYPPNTTNSSGHHPFNNPFAEELADEMDMVLFKGPILPCQTRSFVATIVLMPLLRDPILPGTNCELYLQGVEMPCRITALLSVTLAATEFDADGQEKPKVQKRPKILREGGRTATVKIEVATFQAAGTITNNSNNSSSNSSNSHPQGQHEILVDPFPVCRALGRFALRAKGFTVAVGVIDDPVG